MPDGIVVVTGGTQALTITARALAGAGHHRIAVEDPGDPVYRHLLQVHGPVPVPVDGEGLVVSALREAGCRAVLTSPGYQFPTGAVMSAARRTSLLEWAVASSALVIEDDHRADFHFGGRALACLQGMRPAQGGHRGLRRPARRPAPGPGARLAAGPDAPARQPTMPGRGSAWRLRSFGGQDG